MLTETAATMAVAVDVEDAAMVKTTTVVAATTQTALPTVDRIRLTVTTATPVPDIPDTCPLRIARYIPHPISTIRTTTV